MSDGIVIKVEQGDKKIEIRIGKDVDPEQLRVIQKVLEKFAESSSSQTSKGKQNNSSHKKGGVSRFFKVKTIIATYFKDGQWFTSIDLRDLYEEIYKEVIPANTASTYLRRLEKMGVLKGRKRGKIIEYVLIDEGKLEAEFDVEASVGVVNVNK